MLCTETQKGRVWLYKEIGEKRMVQVCKRDCSYVDFDKTKISNAIIKAMKNGGVIEPEIAYSIADEIEEFYRNEEVVSIYDIESMVFKELVDKNAIITAKSYEGYRKLREFQRENSNTTDTEIQELLGGINDYWNGENSNKNPRLVTTQRDYLAGIASKDISRRFLLPPEILQAHEDAILHFHDIDYFAMKTHNCDLINLEDMLQNGTVISETLIEKPHSFSTACNIATQIIAQVASSQYGGQSISLAHLAPFVDISRQKIRKKVKAEIQKLELLNDWDGRDEFIETVTSERLMDEIKKGIQTIQYQVVTLMTTNGQAPFLTVFMYLNEANGEQEKADLAILIEETLNQRCQGVKNEQGVWITPAFPKLIYVLEEDNISEGSKYWYLTELAAKCTAKRMVPDYISEKVMMELKGDVYTCMGCVDGQEIITYRFGNQLFVEAFERMWYRLSDHFDIKNQTKNSPNMYMDLCGVEIYDTEKGFVNTKRIIRNLSDDWVDVHLSNGRRLLCTSDHPFEIIGKGIVHTSELSIGDRLKINSSQYSESNIVFNNERAWFLGFMLCDGCYQNNHIFSSIAATGEDDIEKKFVDIVKKQFGLHVDVILQERGKKGVYKDLCIKADKYDGLQKLISYLSTKFSGINKLKRQIPNEVFSWSDEAKLSFLAGMIDADGYINTHSHGGCTVQIGSTNKELALQQMALAQALHMPARMYHNHYSRQNSNLIRYRIEFKPTNELLNYVVCKKKQDHFIQPKSNLYANESEIIEIIPLDGSAYSYDVTTDSEHFEVSGIYSHNCRSFLTPDRFTEKGVGNIANAKNYEEGKHKYYGRFNQGVVTLNLPDIALSSGGDFKKFWELFNERTELCHKALRIRHEHLKGTPSDVAPILWRYGALARLEKGETIDKLLYDGYSTISLGYAGLYECVMYMTGCSHSDESVGETFGLKVMQALNDKCNKWKAAENIDYSLYGTPLESTTYKFATKLQERFGIIEGITDRDYITNSYHIPVFEEIDPFEKLRIEAKFQKLSPGGAISYIETCDMQNNIPAVLGVLKFIYENIMYAELNTKSDYCQVCGYDGEIELVDKDGKLIWKCPNCGNQDTNKMNVARRTCGYLGTATNGWNQGRLGDIRDRYVHLDDHVSELERGESH